LIDIDFILTIAFIIGNFGLVIWLYFWARNINNVRNIIHLTELQVRPWVGPIDSSTVLKSTLSNDKAKYVIKIKNFGKTKTKNVTVNFLIQDHKFNRKTIINSPNESLDLGPLHPEMEKDYWFYIDSDKMQKARSNAADVYIGLYISYDFETKKNGYGMIGHFDSHENDFVKTEMWDD
jgi:hypothetical protein